MNDIYLWLMIFVGAIILYRIFSWHREDAKREAKMEHVSHEWRITLYAIAEAALRYRGPATEHQRGADARTLDHLLAQYKKLKQAQAQKDIPLDALHEAMGGKL